MDEQYMARALQLAAKGRYSVSPNPMVGCVVVKDGEIIGEGFHQRAGMAHAEVEALRSCRVSALGATAYTTLEPCNHTGRTPPCTEVLIAAGVRRVVAAIQDPHPTVNGRGIEALRSAGVDVTLGLMKEQAERLNEKFLFAARTNRPFLLIKAAMTLDGKLATIDRQSRWITSAAARERSLALREEYDAIMVGSGTVVADNPQLTRRLGWNSSVTPWLRVVLDARGEVPATARVLTDGMNTLLISSQPNATPALPPHPVPLSPAGRGERGEGAVEVVPLEATDGKFSLPRVLDLLGSRGIQSVIAEGGSLLLSDLIRNRLWQKMIVFVAPLIVGGNDAPSLFADNGIANLADAYRLQFDSIEQVEDDLMIVAYPN